MSAVDRVMRAYASKHDLTERQAAFVREEISRFIDELTASHRRPPMMFPETNDARAEGKQNAETAGLGAS
jgi:hypothetical protein